MPAFESAETIQYLHTIRDFIRWGASRMNEAGLHFGHGTDNAIDDASALVLHVLHLPADLSENYLESVLTPVERRTVFEALKCRVRERKPTPYITNQAWFMDLPFYVDERVLVPRSPIAELIEHQFSPWLNPERVERILDLCTGSGCIGIACAYAFPQATIDLADVSTDALDVARRNIKEHGLEERVEVIASDLFAALEGRRYDLIVSNPPYVSASEMAVLPAEYHHEPVLGLEAGEQGLNAVVDILRCAGNHLKEGGILVVEVGNTWHTLRMAFPEAPFVWLDFERGGEGVFLITAEQLRACGNMLQYHRG